VLHKYLREYDKNTAKKSGPILEFPFFPNWIGILHRKVQHNCEVKLMFSYSVFHNLEPPVLLSRASEAALYTVLWQPSRRSQSNTVHLLSGNEICASCIFQSIQSSCLYDPTEATAFVYYEYFFCFFEIF
jgi:hypothetical protein